MPADPFEVVDSLEETLDEQEPDADKEVEATLDHFIRIEDAPRRKRRPSPKFTEEQDKRIRELYSVYGGIGKLMSEFDCTRNQLHQYAYQKGIKGPQSRQRAPKHGGQPGILKEDPRVESGTTTKQDVELNIRLKIFVEVYAGTNIQSK